ncbi:MAG: hypothetical protein WA793_08695 [Sphingorhabdus sp.]|uniref:hypothetical protein n=1 Tax=Sphingorhabdus sp. TaxID=1902408 RepID=UPI003CB296CB
MKSASLAGLRISTGLLLMVWGLIRVGAPNMGAHVSEKYYAGLGAAPTVQVAWGIALLILGSLVVLGLFRRYALPAQAVVLVTGALAIWKYLLDPLGMYLLDRDTSQVLFFPSLGIAFATLVLIAFRNEDHFALDHLIDRHKTNAAEG